MPLLSAASMAAKFDFMLRTYGQPVGIYRKGHSVDQAARPSDNAVGLVTATKAMLQFGDDVAAEASAAGIPPDRASRAFFLSTTNPPPALNDFLRDQDGVAWKLESTPAQQGGPTPIGLSALLQRQVDKPAGMP